MPYEYPGGVGVPRLFRAGCQWAVGFNGRRRRPWASPDDAALAAVRHAAGLEGCYWTWLCVSANVLRWRPVCTNL